jgi:hypothetical protein
MRRLVAFLRAGQRTPDPNFPDYGHDLYVPNVMYALMPELIENHRRATNTSGAVTYEFDLRTNSSPFYRAAWVLVNRGILSPDPTFPAANGHTSSEVAGAGFSVTDYGRKWLAGSVEYACLPSEYARFGQLLNAHASRFGGGFQSRSQEALSCYQARLYLSCCVMCGAAAESILLALAIERKGNAEDVLKDYRTGSGRSKIEGLILAQQNSFITRELPNFTSLLNYWRDESAHGASTNLSEEEAFTSLILLLRFAHFADQRWQEITRPL